MTDAGALPARRHPFPALSPQAWQGAATPAPRADSRSTRGLIHVDTDGDVAPESVPATPYGGLTSLVHVGVHPKIHWITM